MMKSIHIAIAGMLTVSTLSLPAVAGPDWSVIQDARKISSLHKMIEKPSLEKEGLPIDHGPRALSTSWLNKEQAQIAQFGKTASALK
jgi:hypothetical protein